MSKLKNPFNNNPRFTEQCSKHNQHSMQCRKSLTCNNKTIINYQPLDNNQVNTSICYTRTNTHLYFSISIRNTYNEKVKRKRTNTSTYLSRYLNNNLRFHYKQIPNPEINTDSSEYFSGIKRT